ncbi:MATE family efflux transporter [Anoxynatronum buryatiense]|uniref:Multidrug export protein MepA n=1 Tax=Anoxynatronum buryatiense TaxID=489973 RepID=A0AA45WX99_9CLOT|nr:MATE family efflux transporter [Anoxynatronum buryatiense]SMP61506.1 putative efflux protein, MATE family [Anoxynatronum buryatiense]
MSRSHQMEHEKMSTILLRLSIPATIAMMVNALYNIVDSIFIGQGVGYMALGGLTIAFPVQMGIMAMAQMIGIGAASAVSRYLGAKDREKALHVVGNSYIAVVLMGIIICALGLIFIDPILRIFGATDLLMPYAKDYLQVILVGSLYFPFVISANNLIRAEGNARAAMLSMLVGTIANIFLDYLFIFPLQMGIRGAALATIISQFISLVYILAYFYGEHSSLKVQWKHMKLNWQIQKDMMMVGSSSFARQAAGSLMAIVLNNSLGFYGGELALAVYGIIQRVIMFLFMPMFGIVQGMQPIAGFNYGAKRMDRVSEVVRLSIIGTTALALFSTIFGQLFPETIIRLFNDDPALLEYGVLALRVVIAMVPVVGVQIIGAALFQSLGKAVPALVLTLSRQVLFFIPLVAILPRVGGLGLMGIWLAFPLADGLSTIFTSIWMKREMNRMKKELAA